MSDKGGDMMDKNEFIRTYYNDMSDGELGHRVGLSANAVQKRRKRMGLERSEEKVKPIKTGVESRMNDKVIINWTTRTVITDLGEFGSYSCNISTHNAIQRAYVHAYEGKGETASEVAVRFEFPHAQAVLVYAKRHGFTKSSVPQTDLEFEEGMTPEEASRETLQSLKRRTIKMTERKKWQKVQSDADKWNNFDLNVKMPMKDWIEENLPKYTIPVFRASKAKEPYAAVVGVSDWHYMKLAFDYLGKETYNREIALKKLREANNSLINHMLLYGAPDKIYIPVGTDNLHVDNPLQTTTKGTSQARETDGDWTIEIENYFETVVKMIELYAQIAPVEVVSIPGNHDKNTSHLLGVTLKLFFDKHKRVNVTRNSHPRLYLRYGTNCLVFDHGDDKSLRKFQGNMHKMVLTEAKAAGINIAECDEYIFFSGHMHFDMSVDLGGVRHHIIPSLSSPDAWHRENLYVGLKEQAALYIIGRTKGERAILYS